MNELLKNKVALVAGSQMHIITSITRTFLLEGAIVIVPARSAGEISVLKESLAEMNAEKLVTLITDYPDYYNAFNVGETIMEEFGKIDIAVLCFNRPFSNSVITETSITDWEKMIDENITAYFVSARIAFNCMKNNKQPMFVSICLEEIIADNTRYGLADLSSLIQKKLAGMFYEAFKEQHLRFYHILLMTSEQNSTRKSVTADKFKVIDTSYLNDYLLQLYKAETENSDDLFHSFLEHDVSDKQFVQ